MLSTLLSLTLAVTVSVGSAAQKAQEKPQENPQQADSMSPIDPAAWTTPGRRIPDVELPRVDGRGLVRLSDFEGKRLLLIQFASW